MSYQPTEDLKASSINDSMFGDDIAAYESASIQK